MGTGPVNEEEPEMTLYAALIYTHDGDWSSPEELKSTSDYAAFGEAAGPAIQGGAALHPTSTATTVRVLGGKGGEVMTTDGPFAESKEVLAGFYLLEAADLDAAVGLAAQIPAAWDGEGAVEVRPVLPM